MERLKLPPDFSPTSDMLAYSTISYEESQTNLCTIIDCINADKIWSDANLERKWFDWPITLKDALANIRKVRRDAVRVAKIYGV
jgi:hypothetical protein